MQKNREKPGYEASTVSDRQMAEGLGMQLNLQLGLFPKIHMWQSQIDTPSHILSASPSLTCCSAELLLRAVLILVNASDASMKRILAHLKQRAQRYSTSNLVMRSKYVTE